MKLLGILIAIAVALYLGVMLAFPTYTHRFRLTVEIDTPEGVRSGSSVIEVVRKDVRWVLIAQGRFQFHVRGEAVFIDLGANRNVIALLTHSSRGENVDQMISLPIEAYGYYKWNEEAWAHRAKMQGAVELKPPLIPTLVTIADVSDPKTAQVIYATDFQEIRESGGALRRVPRLAVDRFDEKFGPGVRFKRAWIEALPAGRWPFNLFRITGAPLTHEIERRVPMLLTHREQLRGIVDDMPPRFQPHYHSFKRD